MNDVKKINRQFFMSLMMMIGVVILAAAGIVLLYIFVKNENITYPVTLLIFIGLIIGGSLFKNRLDRITNMSYLVRIRESQGQPLPITQLVNFNTSSNLFKKNGFDKYQDNETFTIYYKCELDHIKKIFRNNILTVMVLIKNKNTDFYLDRIDKEINKLRDQLFKEKRKVNRIIITQIKEIDELDDKTRDMIKEIIFVRTKSFVISTINIGIYRPQHIAVMLYSNTYSPSLYYKYHLDEIRNIL
ncbi:hypothetical protein [Mariniplasma anaerobium]|uniref:Uncharacterized protein n=1 Tax=Mariniplasma anaerobium TaxID=2735436 RepID=A0A7U9TJL2_9MOLU|nr:hypothetical protein [Mariniplasma anaerobium]BCR36581.1 hypothetical protein MPAN_014740 [Mariniplasma anaerobium]